jgi:hypothetical protein
LSLNAQSGIVKIKNGKVVEGQHFFDKLLIFDQYKEGRVTIKDGAYYTGLLNVNTLTQSLRMISMQGDTIVIDAESKVETVSAQGDFFRKLDNYYVQILNIYDGVSLGLVRKMVIGKEEVIGAYGGTTDVASMAKVSSLEVDARIDKIAAGSNTIRYEYDELLFLVKGDRMYPATRKNFRRLFSRRKSDINSYIKANDISFADNSKIAELFNYLSLSK